MRVMRMGPSAQLAVGWLTMFVVGTDLFVVSPLLPLIAGEYRLSPAAAGLCVTVFSLVYMVSAPLFGAIADRIGRRRVLIYSLAVFAVANLSTAAAGDPTALLAARLLAGAAAAGISPSIYALVSAAAPPQRRATRMALVVSGLLVSLALGAPIGEMAAASIGWGPVFVALALSSLALLWPNYRIWPCDQGTTYVLQPLADAPAATIVAWRLVPTVLWSTGLYGTYTYLGAALTALGFSPEAIARAIMFYGCGAIAGVLIGGRMADRLGARFTAGIGMAGLCACLLALRLALDAGPPVAPVLGLTSAVAQLFFPAQQAALASDFPTRRATVFAWNNSALFLGIALGSLVGGQAVARVGFGADLTICAGIALSGCIITAIAVPGSARIAARTVDDSA
jgi:predicted MFS family arabinose efflux permease